MAQQPMYQKIAEDLRIRIELGATFVSPSDGPATPEPTPLESGQLPAALRPGSRLPTELELCDAYAASRNTIREAIKRLISQGLVETRQGQGTFVIQAIDPFVTVRSPDPKLGVGDAGEESASYLSAVNKQHRKARASEPRVEVQPCPREIALRLRIKPGNQVISRHQVRFIDEIPWLLQTSYYPMDFITKGATRLLMAEDITEGTVRYLAETLGLLQVGYRDWVTARGPDNTEQAFFGLAHDATVFELFRTGFAQNMKPMRVTVTVYPADRNQIIFNFGEVPDIQYEQAEESDGAGG
jgi:GntR family transcriptional regulator